MKENRQNLQNNPEMWPTQFIKIHFWMQTMFRAVWKIKHDSTATLKRLMMGGMECEIVLKNEKQKE